MKRTFFCIFILMLAAVFSLSAIDFGLIISQNAGIETIGADEDSLKEGFSYSTGVNPWLTVPIGKNDFGKFYLSAGLTVNFANSREELITIIVIDEDEGITETEIKEFMDGTWSFVPELLRTELSLRLTDKMSLSAGRTHYRDPLGFVAGGLFDGAYFSLDLGRPGIFSAGLWYTGLLYKKTTEITMTDEDQIVFNRKLDYSDLANTYFGSRRLLAALDWDIPSLTEWLSLHSAIISQTDLTGNKNRYHSQYLTVKATVPASIFTFNMGACLQLSQLIPDKELEDTETKIKLGLAGELGASMAFPASFQNLLSLNARFSSGTVKDSVFSAFVPVTTQYQGDILEVKLSGISSIDLNYIARLNRYFSFSLGSACYILSDLGTYKGYPGINENYFLGAEFSGRLIWAPFSDLIINLGGGMFLPYSENAEGSRDIKWKINLSVSLMVL